MGFLLFIILLLVIAIILGGKKKKDALEDGKYFEGKAEGFDVSNKRMTVSMGNAIEKLADVVAENKKKEGEK